MQIRTIPCGPFQVNTYIAYADHQQNAVVIDPGDPAPILQTLQTHRLICEAILLTHGHFDHIFGLAGLHEATRAAVYVHEADAVMLGDSNESLAIPFAGIEHPEVQADVLLRDGDLVQAGGLLFRVLHTPGHTMGGVCYLEEAEQAAFCGDTVFLESIGRTDFPHSDPALLIRSIQRKLLPLDDAVALFPGHGNPTTIGHERAFNPYFQIGGSLL